MIKTERKCIEILRILKDHEEPLGAKRLSEIMAERGFVLSDRAVQYYLRYLDDAGFTRKIGNQGRLLTEKGLSETDQALVDDRIGFIISKLERLAFRSTFNPATGTGDVAYNLSTIPEERADEVIAAFDQVIAAECGFFNAYRVIDRHPKVPPGHVGFITVCSITMDGVFQRQGIPVKVAYGGTMAVQEKKATEFTTLIGYRGTTIDPLQLFISSGLTRIHPLVMTGTGIALVNIRQVPLPAEDQVRDLIRGMRSNGFVLPVEMGQTILNVPPDPHRISIASYSGMNLIGNCVELGIPIRTEIGAGNIQFSKVVGDR